MVEAVPARPAGTGPEVTNDSLLGGAVRLRQPAAGYRVAIDPVFLAAAVPAWSGEAVLDLGAGVGAASLCLARRVTGCHVTGIEIQPELMALARDNIALNGLAATVEVIRGDIAHPPPRLAPGTFDHVLANPPHLEAGTARPSPHPGKALAHVDELGLARWVGFALAMARAGGCVTFIHRADRLDALLGALGAGAGGIVVFPLWPSAGRAAKRVLVQGRKGAAAPMRLAAGLVLHEGTEGGYTPAAEAVLRGGGGLVL